MKIPIFLFLTIVPGFVGVYAQKRSIDSLLAIRLSDIRGKIEPQQYSVTLKWQNLDPVKGNELSSNIARGTYVTGLKNGYVGWKDVSLSAITPGGKKEVQHRNLPSFDKLSYPVLNTDFLKQDFYSIIPQQDRDLAKWLVSDGIQLYGMTAYLLDSLKFNTPFIPGLLTNYDIKFENWVSFLSRYQKLTWTGITTCNGEICAIINFESFFNPLEMDQPEMSLKGRSLYWGELLISLRDKQLERGRMMEDAIVNLKTAARDKDQLFNIQREVTFEKTTKRQ